MRNFVHDMTINVNKNELINILTENKNKHIKNRKEAIKNWQLECKERLTKQLTELSETGNIKVLSVLQHPPEDMSSNYQSAIDMLTWHTQDSVTLDQEQFAAFVQDKWEWSSHWTLSNSKYLG